MNGEGFRHIFSKINFAGSALDAKAIDIMNRFGTLFDEYTTQIVIPRNKPFTQTAGSRRSVAIVTHNPTGLVVAVDYLETAHKNREEAMRIIREKVAGIDNRKDGSDE